MTIATKTKKKLKEYQLPTDNLSVFSDSGANRAEFFRHKNTVIFRGDVLNPDTFDKEFIDLIVTSPPYNVGIDYNSNDDTLSYQKYLEFTEKWMTNCFNWSKPQARFLLNCPLDKNKGGQQSVGADLTLIAKKIGWKHFVLFTISERKIITRQRAERKCLFCF